MRNQHTSDLAHTDQFELVGVKRSTTIENRNSDRKKRVSLLLSNPNKKGIILICGSCILVWWMAANIRPGFTITQHASFDQHTLQAIAWVNGTVSLPQDLDRPWLEIASYGGRLFNSFPPTPTLIEFPLVMLFGHNTPSSIVMLFLSVILMLLIRSVLKIKGWTNTLASFLSGFIVLGSNIICTATDPGVWHYNQILGAVLVVAAVRLVIEDKVTALDSALSLGLIALSIGCRPFHAFYFFPIAWMILSRLHRESQTHFQRVKHLMTYSLPFAAPVILAMLWYNYFRFDNPFEFGHAYLSAFKSEPILSLEKIPKNAWFVFLEGVKGGNAFAPLNVDYYGFSVLLHSPHYALGFIGMIQMMFRRGEERSLGAICLVVFLLYQLLLLMHQSNGWAQFGYRFAIDLLGLLVIGLGQSNLRQVVLKLVSSRLGVVTVGTYVMGVAMLNYYGIWYTAHGLGLK